MKMSTKRKISTRGLGRVLREQRARLYIIKRCSHCNLFFFPSFELVQFIHSFANSSEHLDKKMVR
ncbi:hypothetical protein ACJIZ3_020094 [Penstemon smallii]|uniref:Uncharacterized protein n=1 Tax=Penstemon smallii TaxID=265156 RepID=A0ABD3SI94_9LAMI